MAKEKFNVGNLLPVKPEIIKTEASAQTAPLLDKAVETIHSAPAVETKASASATEATRKISCDLPESLYKFIKRYCVDHDITMREYLLELIEKDLKRKK